MHFSKSVCPPLFVHTFASPQKNQAPANLCQSLLLNYKAVFALFQFGDAIERFFVFQKLIHFGAVFLSRHAVGVWDPINAAIRPDFFN